MKRVTLPSSRLLVLGLLGVLLVGCKGTEEHLAEIAPGRAVDKRGQLNPLVYDAGQLVHESLVGLQEAETLTSSQVLRASWRAAAILADNSVPLCRAQAVDLLVHLVRHLPLPPREVPYDAALEAKDSADILTELYEAVAPLEVEVYVQSLGSPDRTESERALEALREVTGQDFGRDVAAWEAWWESEKPNRTASVDTEADATLRRLAAVRMNALRSTYLVVQALTVVDLYRPSLEAARWEVVGSFVRQLAVMGVVVALEDQDSVLVRNAGVRGARALLDPAFEAPLKLLVQREHDLPTLASAFELLAYYPSGEAVELLVLGAQSDRPAVARAAQRSLEAISGAGLGEDPEAWRDWYQREARKRWR